MELFLKGLLLGFAIAIPVGPIGALALRKTLHYGRLSGFCTGLGAAVADTFYGALAIFGLTIISDFFLAHRSLFQLVGGLFLAYLALTLLLTKTPTKLHALQHSSPLKDFFTTLALTLANPMTILLFILIFAGFGISASTTAQGSLFIFGILLGSTTWWFILSTLVSFFRKSFSPRLLQWINRGACLILLSFSVWFLVNALSLP